MVEEITKDNSISQVIQDHPETIPVFMKHGLGCIGCALATFETIEQGALAHGMDIEALMRDINKSIKNTLRKEGLVEK